MNKIHQLAEFAYVINKAYCESIGDFSQPEWSEVDFDSQFIYLLNVTRNLKKEMTPEEAHNVWMKVRKSEGWVYGPIKDLAAKTHPCMVPWNEVPQEQKIKDFLFLAVLKLWKD